MMPLEGQHFTNRYAGMGTVIHANHWSSMIDDRLEQLRFKYPSWAEEKEPEVPALGGGGGAKLEGATGNDAVDEDKKDTEAPDTKSVKETKANTRKSPKEQAKLYEIGFTKAGEDGKLWVVKGYESGMRRWVRHKSGQ